MTFRTHKMILNANETDTGNPATATISASAPACKHYFPCTETAAPITDIAAAGGNLNTGLTVADQGDGSLAFVTGVTGGGYSATIAEPGSNDFIVGCVFTVLHANNKMYVQFGAAAAGYYRVHQDAGTIAATMDDGSTALAASSTKVFVIGETHCMAAVRDGLNLRLILDGVELESIAISAAFAASFAANAIADELWLGAIIAGSGQACWGFFDYIFEDGLPNNYIQLLADIKTNLAANNKILPAGLISLE